MQVSPSMPGEVPAPADRLVPADRTAGAAASTDSAAPSDPPSGRDPALVRAMFDALAPRYDLFNDVLSAGIHRRWRARAIDALAPEDGRRYLDLCAGTLDLALAILARAPRAQVTGVDFSLPMLARGCAKSRERAGRRGGAPVRPVAADALRLPFPDRTFAGCTIGFGLRNLADYGAGLAEIRRVLEPGGRVAVLEFTTPPGRLFRAVYHGYFHHVLPRLGARIAGNPGTARYLPDSVSRFPGPAALAALLEDGGFTEVRWRLLTRGIAALHTGVRAPGTGRDVPRARE
ncbi:MAG TPA: class I SAM-dependent methyltransferase [Gemmatimonadota bacterium]|nr:class I SAM-dependent methyltransferase [Gemmatimonadota bacterium]